MKINLLVYESYKAYLKDVIKSRPNNGRGELRRLSQQLNVHSTLISQIVNGVRHFSFEQAIDLCKILGLSQKEVDYFMLLLQYERAGSENLKKYLFKKISATIKDNTDLKEKFTDASEIKLENKIKFYSDWSISACRLATDFNGSQTVNEISGCLNLNIDKVKSILEFLLDAKLVNKTGNKYSLAQQTTHIQRDSPIVIQHHRNWRLKAMENFSSLKPKDFSFTAPMGISTDNSDQVFTLLTNFVEEITNLAKNSKTEELRFISMDWHRFDQKK